MTKNYGLLDTVEDLKVYFKKVLDGGQTFAFDIESGYDGAPTNDISTSVFHPRWKLVGFSFTDSTEWARYVPIAHDSGQNAPTVAAARLLWTLLQTGRGVPHNAMFELQGVSRWFREVLWDDTFYGEAVRRSNGLYPIFSDTMIEANMVQRYRPLAKGQGVGVGLKGLVKHIFGHQMRELTSLFPDLKAAGTTKQLRFNTLELNDESVEYACEDSAWTLALHEHHYDEVKDLLMFKTEILLLPVLCEMEQEGLVLDWAEYERQSVIIENFKNSLNEEIQNDLSEKLGEVVNVNFNSPSQVAKLLYEKMELPLQVNKKTKRPTTDDKAMNYLARVTNDPSLLKILEWRGVSKLLSSYITKYLNELRYDPNGRARPNHNQLGAGTGRFSVDGVSYQQWPKPYHFELKNGEEFDLNYRNFLIAPEGFRIVGFDFAQVEMRVLAGVVGETAMLEAFANGEDLHKKTASVMFGIPLEEVTPKQRQAAKGLNFGILYGQGADALAEILEISKEEAQDLLHDYFDGFSKLRAWMDAQDIRHNSWRLEWLIETHVHADHLSASAYIQTELGGTLAIGRRVTLVQQIFGEVFNAGPDFPRDGSQFDRLLDDGDTYRIGTLTAHAMDVPGHTPACMAHIIGDAAFVADTLFLPDSGTARADFRGGSAAELYRSIRRLMLLPQQTRVFVCHDYGEAGRPIACQSSIAEERAYNSHIHDGITEEQFVALRTARDAMLPAPKLIIPSLQINMRGGRLPQPESNGLVYLKTPLGEF